MESMDLGVRRDVVPWYLLAVLGEVYLTTLDGCVCVISLSLFFVYAMWHVGS